ncbi:MAG: metallopeptidase family protein [Actinobacteria bacterium]|nr:metallopeptidase family protein [Actinomycetota bacterium]
MIDVAAERFEELVADALDSIPDELGRYIDNVAVFVNNDAPPGRLYGLYEGVPLTRRETYGGLAMPDRVTIFRQAICRDCATEDEVMRQVQTTVVHEIAHHFGINDARLTELGYG